MVLLVATLLLEAIINFSLLLLWYGFIYYVIFLFLTSLLVLTFFKLFYINVFYKLDLVFSLMRYILSFFLFFTSLSLITLYYLLDFFSTFTIIYTTDILNVLIFNYYCYDYLISSNNLSLNLISIYYFPFIYIFLIITTLSILFCLTYNINEIISFMFYCTIILMAGYILFFTDSLILFFFSYELLLIPSFFILYNFAKTRRCVEAAYLMFF